ncbi:MAG: MBL fold metallo-hydrolase [Cyanobacteriota bacterium]|nr:MBL fold metallo-hydrolase [Cyanobacteriota bacterium]
MALHATYLGANGWLLEFEAPGAAPLRVLLDPWLVGELRFLPGDWFFTGRQTRPQPIPEHIDLLLLTQGLPDHAHPPTLEQLPRSIPVVGSPSAAKVAGQLGFSQVMALAPGERCTAAGDLVIEATPGAPVPQVENGYLLRHPRGSLYAEPHGYLANAAQLPAQRLDAVITPVVDLGLPVAGAFVRGRSVLPELLERFQPATVLASTAGGDISFEGLLNRLLWQKGTPDEAAQGLPAGTALIDPVPGERLTLKMAAAAAA